MRGIEMKKSFESYFKDIPDDFELTVKALASSFRIAVTLFLIEEDSLSLSELTKHTDRDVKFVLEQLKLLELSGIVQNFLQKKKDVKEYSFYKITRYGKKIVSGFTDTYNKYYSEKIKSDTLSLNTKE